MTARLEVSLDVTAVPPSPAGAGRYTIELAGALARHPEVALQLVARRHDGRWSELDVPVWAGAPTARPLRLAWEQFVLPRLLRRMAPAVHHGPHYTMPERAPVPCVVTIHDCTFFDHPEWHERSKVHFFRRAIKVAAEKASAVVCVSEATAGDLRRHCAVRGPVFVAPHGVDLERFSPQEPAPGADAALLERLGLGEDRPYVLFVGTVEPRKNVEGLVRAFDRLSGRHPDLLLVLAGQPGWGEADLDRAIAAAPARGRIVRTGYVPDAAVPALLRHAAAVAYPSHEEGYGLPALEALACGAPLVTTEGTAMAELSGGAAWLVPPGDDEALAVALESLLEAPSHDGAVAARRRLGLEVAASRTWAASAAVHLEAYRSAAGMGA